MRRCLNKYMFHRWGKWKRYTYNVVTDTGIVQWVEIRQERFCERCNKCQDQPITILK